VFSEELYILLHAVGNKITLVAKVLSKNECLELREAIMLSGDTGVERADADLNLGTLSCIPQQFY
jgi:hypothetical protein